MENWREVVIRRRDGDIVNMISKLYMENQVLVEKLLIFESASWQYQLSHRFEIVIGV